MKFLLIALSFLLASALALPLVTEEPWEPWTGPIADHQLGVHPSDTPEVSEAKTQHLRAYEELVAVLPELPLQDDSGEENVAVFMGQPEENEIPEAPIRVHEEPETRVATFMKGVPLGLAEEIPRSEIGEVPEVHAARLAHMKAMQEAFETAARFQRLS